MKTILFYDTETTGLPNWKTPSGGEDQPHIVQIGALLVDVETKEVLKELDVIVKPEGWEIPEDTIEVHGITNEHALEVGIPEKEAITHLLDMLHSVEGVERVAYNRTFDQRIIRIGLKRFFSEEVQDVWAEKDNHHCAMLMAKKICKIEPKGRYGYKNPKLSEAYKFFTGEELEGAHNALVDTKAAMTVYFACLEYNEE
jgi:DNA polymerase III subunit epsilon